MIEKEVKEYIGDVKYFITGSRRFGVAKKHSDLDICVRISDRLKLYKKAEEPTESCYNNGFKCVIANTEVNIIPLHPVDFVAWFFASELMTKVPKLETKSRPEIHGLHETFIGLMKSQFAGECINNETCITICGLKDDKDEL